MGRPKKLNTTEKTTKAVVDTPETVTEVAVEVAEDTVDVIEEVETIEETVEVNEETTDVEDVKEPTVSVDPTFVPATEDELDDPKFKYVEPTVTVEVAPEVVKPVRLDHLRHGAHRNNVQQATKMYDGFSSGVKVSTKVAKMF